MKSKKHTNRTFAIALFSVLSLIFTAIPNIAQTLPQLVALGGAIFNSDFVVGLGAGIAVVGGIPTPLSPWLIGLGL